MQLFYNKIKHGRRIENIPLSSIVPNRSQPRKQFDETAIMSLSRSISENGIIQPVCVRKNGVIYEIISGERRCRAAKLAGLTEVPCIVMEVDDEKSAVLALIENIQRSDLSFFEEAIAINELINVYGLTQQEAANRLGKAQSTIANKLRLLRFSDAERNILVSGNITERQARALIRIDDQDKRMMALHQVMKKSLNLQQTEQLVDEILKKTPREKVKRKSIFELNIPKIYINSINKIINRMKSEHINCETYASQHDGFYEYTIKIPLSVDMCK